jgi:tetratricopeptide (TPR) repeat protein
MRALPALVLFAALAWVEPAPAQEPGVEDVTGVLETFAQAGTSIRRARALSLLAVAGPDHIRACALLARDADIQVRQTLIKLYRRPDFGSQEAVWRTSILTNLAEGDPARVVRDEALAALGVLDGDQSAAALARLTRELPAPDRARAARGLAASSRGWDQVAALVQAGLGPAPPSQRTPPDVLAELLGAYSLGLVDREARPLAWELEPLVAALNHPEGTLGESALAALGQMLARLVEKGNGPRALDTMEALLGAGLDPVLVHYHRARLALYPAGDPQTAVSAARALAAQAREVEVSSSRNLATHAARMEQSYRGMVRRGREWLVRARYLEGLGQFALGDLDAAQARLEEALSMADAIRADRWDRSGIGLPELYADDLFHCALVEVALVIVQLERGVEPSDATLLQGLWRAYRNQLGTQLLRAGLSLGGGARTAQGSWDALLDSELSPYRLLFARRNMPGLSIEKALDLQARLGRALATLTPDEQPGFEPLEGLEAEAEDVAGDPFPRAWLAAILERQLDQIEDERYRIRGAMTRAGGTGWEVQESDLERLERLSRQRRSVLTQQALLDSDPQALRRDLRLPATQALWLARDLREEGHAVQGRTLALRAREDLERVGVSNAWYFAGVERLVRTALVIGSCYTDEDEPLLAEEILLGAVERLEGVLSRLESGGVSPGALAPFQGLQSNALVSLAVNANVRLGQPDKALGYYERAYALRQDEFMHVLLACYRARSGRPVEARRVLRRVRPGPRTWYNMACTYALLGESGSALDMLEQELKENHSSEASRNRQRTWAAQDPDLASLREDPRFQILTRRTDR